MSSPPPDWSRFTKRIFIERPLPEVYQAWAKSADLTQWFLEEAIFLTAGKEKRPEEQLIQSGDRYGWRWHNWDFTESGRIIEANGKDKISFTFGKGGKVYVKLKPKDKGTEVELLQEEMATDEQTKMNFYVGCSVGWTFWLTNLKAWLEHGITLNAKGVSQSELPGLVNT